MRALKYLSDVNVMSFMIDWTNMINEYRGRRLSHPKDHIVVFSGIAMSHSDRASL